jgi:hypothetical protein
MGFPVDMSGLYENDGGGPLIELSRLPPIPYGTAVRAVEFGGLGSPGTSADLSRADHAHPALAVREKLGAGAVYYVRKGGSDADPGTEDEPFLTLAGAMKRMNAVDAGWHDLTVDVGEGVWDENFVVYAKTLAQRVILRGAGEGTVINGQVGAYYALVEVRDLKAVGGSGCAIVARNASEVTLAGSVWIGGQNVGVGATTGSRIDLAGTVTFEGAMANCLWFERCSHGIVRVPQNVIFDDVTVSVAALRADYGGHVVFMANQAMTGEVAGRPFYLTYGSYVNSQGAGRASIPGTADGYVDATSFFDAPAWAAVKRGSVTLAQGLAANANVNLGDYYAVGSGTLEVFITDGELGIVYRGPYQEVGAAGASSQTVKLGTAWGPGTKIGYFIFP